jgi:hypothetical protein
VVSEPGQLAVPGQGLREETDVLMTIF